eukprot:gene19688-26375_t
MDELLKELDSDLGYVRKLYKNKLAEAIDAADMHYHKLGKPIVSDDVFDYMKDVLRSLDPDNKVLGKVGHENGKVVLPKYMGSMDKIKGNGKELARWCSKYKGAYMITDKLDGISALLCNEPGGRRLLTRGNGTLGEDATFMLQHCQGVPRHLPNSIEYVRGELVLPRADFEKKFGKNPRNVVAGLVNSKRNRKEGLISKVVFVAYEHITTTPLPVSAQYKTLCNAGFDVVAHNIAKQLTLESLGATLQERRARSKFEIDGLVVVDDHPYTRVDAKNPDFAFAFKTMATSQDTADVLVEKVMWEISKDNFIIPTVVYQPVELDGVTMQKATGFNAKFIVDNGIGPGARIVVVRSGQVIPYIISVIKRAKPQMPGDEYVWNESGIHVVAVGENCEHRIRLHIFSRLSAQRA